MPSARRSRSAAHPPPRLPARRPGRAGRARRSPCVTRRPRPRCWVRRAGPCFLRAPEAPAAGAGGGLRGLRRGLGVLAAPSPPPPSPTEPAPPLPVSPLGPPLRSGVSSPRLPLRLLPPPPPSRRQIRALPVSPRRGAGGEPFRRGIDNEGGWPVLQSPPRTARESQPQRDPHGNLCLQVRGPHGSPPSGQGPRPRALLMPVPAALGPPQARGTPSPRLRPGAPRPPRPGAVAQERPERERLCVTVSAACARAGCAPPHTAVPGACSARKDGSFAITAGNDPLEAEIKSWEK